ncbi:meteorin-like protein [Babylonia areolata]|uniref:meteorin-like protein n=1 Tax=Babylonia areolata TaxID=304850 RepID=UPI003FD3660C
MDVYQMLSALLVLVLHGRPVWLQGTCDQCDCQLSSDDDERAILSVKTRCRSGTIEWNSAYGAIRLEATPYLTGDYRFCFVVHGRHTVTQVSRETSRPRQLQNYRLRLEELRALMSLDPLVQTSGEEGESEEVCVVGGRGRTGGGGGGDGGSVWLYVEVERTNRFTGIPSVTLQYDVEPVSDRALLDPMEECRPCTEEELLDAYCTSDFVAVGSIHETYQPPAENPEDEEGSSSEHSTHIQVAVAQLIHQNAPVFRRVRRDDRFLYGTVHAPAKCGIRPGHGNFLFTGRMRLGKPKLRCAPFYEDWLKISADAECVYD